MKQELLPFNLEEALKNPERVVYRNGEKPLEWHFFDKANGSSKVVSVCKGGFIKVHKINGFRFKDTLAGYDLFLSPLPEKTYYIDIVRCADGRIVATNPYFVLEGRVRVKLDHEFVKTISFTI